MNSEKTQRKPVPKGLKPWKPGQSGNPKGRPLGSRHKATIAMEQMLDGESDAIVRKAVDLALAGDVTALRLCLERVLPARRDRPVAFSIPKLETPADAVAANAALVEAVSAGEITPSEAMDLSKLIENFVSSLKAHDLEERLARLEEGLPSAGFSSQPHSRPNH